MIGPLILTIASVFKSAGLNQARQALTGASKDFNQFAGSIGKAAGAFGAFQALASARAFVVGAVETANTFERNMLGLQQVFESATPALRDFIKEVESYGLTQGQAAQASVFLGSVLKQYGLTTDEASAQTQRLVVLAQDLATTYGYDVQEALLAMTALFRGEYDPIEKFGVAMKQSEINAYLAAQGLGDLEGAELALAQAQARLTLLYERSADASGAFARATDTLYASQQKLAAIMGNLQIAFGEPLQEPIANVLNLFAEVAQDVGPELIDISTALSKTIDDLAPTFGKLGESVLQTIGLLQPVIELLNLFANSATSILNPALDVTNDTLGLLNQFFDTFSLKVSAASDELARFAGLANDDAILKASNDLADAIGAEAIAGDLFAYLNDQLVRTEQTLKAVSGDFAGFDNGAKRASVSLRGMGYAARDAAKAEAETAAAGKALEDSLRAIGTDADAATGKVSTLSEVFTKIDSDIRKSGAEQSLTDLGLSAGLIEQVLTQPNWEEIFGKISRYAKLAAMDIAKIPSVTAAAAFYNEKAELEKFLASAFTVDSTQVKGKAKEDAKDYVKSFTNSLVEEQQKASAAAQLKAKGASEGLISTILGAENWMSVWQAIKSGTLSLKDLQAQFYKTADGAKELKDASTKAAEELEKQAAAQEELLKKQQEALDEQISQIRALGDELKKISVIDYMPSVAEMGQYESSIARQFDSIAKTVQEAFASDLISASTLDSLLNFVEGERALLMANARLRDEYAKKLEDSKALIAQYRNVFTSSMNLVSMLNQISEKSETVTVTSVSTGLVTLSDSLKEFQVTLTKTYEETIKTATTPTEAVLDGFRQMAQKARDFAANLQKLRDMGLNDELFNQLVEAGVEAGGETAQALVDGGQETVSEVSALFAEIDALGAELGEEVATTFYGKGIDISEGLIAGLTSKVEEFELAGKSLAEAFMTEFNLKVDEAVAKAIAALNKVTTASGIDSVYQTDSTGMPQLITGPGVDFTPMPSVIVAPTLEPPRAVPRPGGSPFPTTVVNVQASSYYGGYLAAQGFTASQSRIATNNGGISTFVSQ